MDTKQILTLILATKQELLRRMKQPLRVYQPDDQEGHNQLVIHKSRAKYKLIFGGNQSGKTVTSAAEIAWWLLGIHPYRAEVNIKPRKVWVIGPEYRMLAEGVWRHLRPDGKDYNGMGFLPRDKILKEGPKVIGHDLPSYVEVAHSTLDETGKPKKSILSFISGEGGESARRRLQAAAVDLIDVDEEIDSLMFAELNMRLLSTDGEFLNSCTLVRSEDYLLELEERAEKGDPEVTLTRLNTARNSYITERAKAEVFRGMSKDELDVRMHGKSRRKHGLVYREFNDTSITDTFPNGTILPPNNWYTVCAMDPGHRIWAALWFAINPEDKTFWFYREMYLHATDITEVAEFIKENEKESITSRVIDPKAFAHSEAGAISIATQLGLYYNLYFSPGQNDRDAGINACHRILQKAKVLNHLDNFKKELRAYKLKADNTSGNQDSKPDIPFKKRDHLVDCMRYGAMHCIGHTVPQARSSNLRPGHSLNDVIVGKIPTRKAEKIAHFALGIHW